MKYKPIITRKEVDDLYKQPIDPLNPFKRLTTLLDWAIQEIKPKKEKEVFPLAECVHCSDIIPSQANS